MAHPVGRAVVVVAAAAAALGCAACSGSSHSPPRSVASGPVPADAVRVVTNVVSRDPVILRDSLARSFSGQVNRVVLAPAGTQIRVLPGTWQRRGSEARLRAVVTIPGRAPVTEVVYLVREEGKWRVLFTDAP